MIFMWHVDDLKISHKYPREVTQFILPIENIYGEGITVTRGKVHYYLGMDFNFSNQVTTKLLMVNYAAQILDDFPEVLTTYATSIPAEHLFQIREDGKKKLSKEQAQDFNHSVAQLLFIAMCARPDLLTLLLFLTKRVLGPDEDDWGKLKRGHKYLMATRHMKLVLTKNSMHTIHWYVDSLYGTHSDCKGHTGMMMTMGFGALMSMSRVQKINVKSSAKA